MAISELRKRYLAHHFYRDFSSVSNILKQLGAIQIDPMTIVAQNHLLVLSSRSKESSVGGFEELYSQNQVFETYAKERCVLPIEIAPLFIDPIESRKEKLSNKIEENKHHILALKEIVSDLGAVSVKNLNSVSLSNSDNSWGPRKLYTYLIYLLWQTGDLLVSKRIGNEVFYTLTPECFWTSEETEKLSDSQRRLLRWEYYLETTGIVDSRDIFAGFEKVPAKIRRSLMGELVEKNIAIPVEVGSSRNLTIVSKKWEASCMEVEAISPRFIPPLDNSIWNRMLVQDIFDFNYKWEIYTPVEKRKFGPYAMPLVTKEGFFGPVDMKFERNLKELNVYLTSSPVNNESQEVKAAAEAVAFTLGEFLKAEKVAIF